MSDPLSDRERGAYTPPTEGPLAFEPRQPVRGARPFPLTLVVSVLVLLGLAAAIFVFYRSGVRQAAGPPQAVGTPVGDVKTAPPADAQPQDAAAGLEIYRSESGQPPQMVPAQPQFTPPPEQPAARPQSGPPVVIAPAPAGPAPTAAPLPPPAKAATPALRPAQDAPPPAQSAAQAPAKPTPVAKPSAKAMTTTVTPPPKAATVEKPKPAPAKPAEEAAPKTTAAKPGAAAVQIGAVSSTALADKTWSDAVALAPGLAAGKGKGVEKVDKDGKTLYRTSVTGFASRADAAAFCARLKAAGKACFVK